VLGCGLIKEPCRRCTCLVYSESPTPSGLAYDKMKKSNISVGWKSDSRERRSGKTKKRLSAEGLIKTYLILLQPAKLRDQAGERVFSWDSRPIWDKGVLRQETEGDESLRLLSRTNGGRHSEGLGPRLDPTYRGYLRFHGTKKAI
jgi:hypothetical protein